MAVSPSGMALVMGEDTKRFLTIPVGRLVDVKTGLPPAVTPDLIARNLQRTSHNWKGGVIKKSSLGVKEIKAYRMNQSVHKVQLYLENGTIRTVFVSYSGQAIPMRGSIKDPFNRLACQYIEYALYKRRYSMAS
ncbi:MAG TPA: hypothetical protein GXX30_10770 [Firmicutes bacterium]|nr:hypothetical protein [Candidatus Fermentithermobacillaceae bacterium]